MENLTYSHYNIQEVVHSHFNSPRKFEVSSVSSQKMIFVSLLSKNKSRLVRFVSLGSVRTYTGRTGVHENMNTNRILRAEILIPYYKKLYLGENSTRPEMNSLMISINNIPKLFAKARQNFAKNFFDIICWSLWST